MRRISIIVPAYNEERYIGPLLKSVLKVPIGLVGFEPEVIVVNDGSSDKTGDIVREFSAVILIEQSNQGKGAAVQRGIAAGMGEYVLVQDADLEYDPQDYLALLKVIPMAGRIAVFGSRNRGVIQQHGWRWPFPGRHPEQSIGPWAMNVILSLLILGLYGKWISDSLTGYKIYPVEWMHRTNIRTRGFETDHELTAKLIRSGVKIVEVPIHYQPRTTIEGKKIRASDGLKAIWTLIRFRWGHSRDFP